MEIAAHFLGQFGNVAPLLFYGAIFEWGEKCDAMLWSGGSVRVM